MLLRRLLDENVTLRRQVGELRAWQGLALEDPLTGLRSRRYLDLRLAEELARAPEREPLLGALVLLDLDELQAINHRHGRRVGDRALRWVAKVLKETLRTTDIACRDGGGRFTAILHDTGAAGADAAITRLRRRLGSGPGDRWAPGAVSMGVASWPADALTAPALMEAGNARLRAERRRRAQGAGRRRLALLP